MVALVLWGLVAAWSGQILASIMLVADARTRWRWPDLLLLAALGVAVLLGRYAWGWMGWASLAAYLTLVLWRGRLGIAHGRHRLHAAALIWRRQLWCAAAIFLALVLAVRLAATRTSLPDEFAPVLLAF